MMHLRPFTLTLLLAVSTACGRTTLPCEPLTCAGCCDAFGSCQSGLANEECGVNAKACVYCARGATCTQGVCLGGTAAGAAGGGSTGGGSAGGGAAGGTGGGFEPSPRAVDARTFAPDLMLVVDRSGSMLQPLDPLDPMCRGCTTACPPGCLTRERALIAAMDRFLAGDGAGARVGLVLYPSNASCGGPSTASPQVPQSDDASVLAMNASAAATQLRSSSFSGGTPTSLALRFAAADAALTMDNRREHLMLLVTDGLPNCNAMNAATCMQPQACRCTIGTGCVGQNCTLGCLDRQASLDALVFAKLKDVSTFVLAFGSDAATTDGAQLFNELAVAGSRPLRCPQGGASECGTGNACLADGTCARKFSNELSAGLGRVGDAVKRSRACRFLLAEQLALDPKLEARVNGLVITKSAEGWQPERSDVVRFFGPACELLLGAPGTPVTFALLP